MSALQWSRLVTEAIVGVLPGAKQINRHDPTVMTGRWPPAPPLFSAVAVVNQAGSTDFHHFHTFANRQLVCWCVYSAVTGLFVASSHHGRAGRASDFQG